MEAIMPDDDDFDRLAPEFLALARRIFDAGAKAERERLVALIQSTGSIAPIPHRERRMRATGYGAVSAPVREVLAELAADSPDGVGARDIARHFERRGGGPSERQVRAALKTLSLTGDAVRASRGKYIPRAAATLSASEEKPGDDASGSLDLLRSMAAE
jgi:hypothetical protein